MNIKSIATLLNVLIPAIQTAEKFIRGRGRGAEKKEATIENVVRDINEMDSETRAAGNTIMFLSILTDPTAREKVGALINAIVDLLNYIKLREGEAAGKKPLILN